MDSWTDSNSAIRAVGRISACERPRQGPNGDTALMMLARVPIRGGANNCRRYYDVAVAGYKSSALMVTNGAGETVAHAAARSNNVELLKVLNSVRRVNLLETKDGNRWTPLATAAFYCNWETVRYLAPLGSTAFIMDTLRRTPLALAIQGLVENHSACNLQEDSTGLASLMMRTWERQEVFSTSVLLLSSKMTSHCAAAMVRSFSPLMLDRYGFDFSDCRGGHL
jgi:ankyrin repeat protein